MRVNKKRKLALLDVKNNEYINKLESAALRDMVKMPNLNHEIHQNVINNQKRAIRQRDLVMNTEMGPSNQFACPTMDCSVCPHTMTKRNPSGYF